MTARGVFITGTDTGVGKTVVAVGLVRGLVAVGAAHRSSASGTEGEPGAVHDAFEADPVCNAGAARGRAGGSPRASAHPSRIAVMKPVASGSDRTPQGLRNDDALQLMAAANVDLPYEAVNPYCFEPAVSPHIAADDAGVVIDRTAIRRSFDSIVTRADYVVVEGAGGWLAPIGNTETMADLAAALELPVLLVVGLRLGCINHAALTKRAIESQGLKFAGWVANSIDPTLERRAENLAALERALAQAPLAIVSFQEHPSGSASLELTAAARKLCTR